ncbi:hypothetical protein [Terracoccus luteus]|uniref:Uncharacterized protein n=1 Tax=Terracoccus luteus TaxID=53356 RepID=A0A839PV41_9MICO|nr:hypothetical protein [Terracoccus luteus]MBB2988118.1 hypothetical protein [Terracoccus luteus]MCP2174142.1 hypothetical protein [Terracoccus luteus]
MLLVAILSLLAIVIAVVETRASRRSPFHKVVPGSHATLLRDTPMPNTQLDGLLTSAIPVQAGLEPARSTDGSGTSHPATAPGDAQPQARWADAALPAGLAAGAGVTDWLNLDENVLDAVGQWTHTDLHNGFDLWRTFHDEGYQLNTAGFAIKLRGHVAEAEIHDQLSSWAGDGLTMPDASNNPVVDMSLGGHDFNVKVGANASTIAEHLREHPDVPVVVNADMDGLPADAFRVDMSQPFEPDVLAHHSVVVADGLVLSDLHEQMADAIGLALDGFDVTDLMDTAGDLGIPVLGSAIRVVRSGIREHKLMEHHGDKSRAMRNIATDVGVVGGSVAGGGALGVGLGAIIDVATFGATAGLGTTVIGPMIGSALGGYFGNKKAAEIRTQPLTRARENVGKATLAYDAVVTDAVNAAHSEWTTTTFPVAQASLEQARTALAEQLSWTLVRARQELADSQASLEADARMVLTRKLDESSQLRPTLSFLARTRRQRWQQAAHSALGHTGQTGHVGDILDVLRAVDGGTQQARHVLEHTARRRARTLATVAEAVRRFRLAMTVTRSHTVAHLRQEQNRLTGQVRTTTHPAAEKVWAAGEQVRKELIATGQCTPQWVAENLPSVPRPVPVPV